jgi:hypothetical protein
MSSFGEADIRINGSHIGRITVSGMRAAPAVFPRLILDLTVLLQDRPGVSTEPPSVANQFELFGLSGELLLSDELVVGTLAWVGPRGVVRSTNYPAHAPLHLVCDLDSARLARIEEKRSGGPAQFRAVLWASLRDVSGTLNAVVDAFALNIPRDNWLRVLEGFQHTRYELVEIPYPGLEEPHFEAALSHLRDAINKTNRGDFDEAVASCRRAIESAATTLNIGHKAAELSAALTPVTDPKRADAYAGIIARLTALGNMTIHRRHAAGKFNRAEAQFIVATTAHGLALVAKLMRRIT